MAANKLENVCHSNETTEGKRFIAFFTFILRLGMQNKLRKYLGEIGLSFSSVLKELRKIKYVQTKDGKNSYHPSLKSKGKF